MAHFAQLDSNNIVLQILTVDNSIVNTVLDASQEQFGAAFLNNLLGIADTWKQTSYSARFRKQYAGIGYKYDSVNDVFISTQPFPSWTLNAMFDWQPPTPMPTDGKMYYWNESTLSWVLTGA